MRVQNISNGQSVLITYPIACITFPEYNIANSAHAAQIFAEILDYAARTVRYEVQSEKLEFLNWPMKQRLTYLIKSEMADSFPGSVFTNGGCRGTVTTTATEYDC
ncbi:MAG: hypothetical protein AAF600_04695 [Bacteroidota bacterium]